ncbi:retrovirus-related pol polyprotein from transposon TNT 1-94 [Tanacetum coccineum]
MAICTDHGREFDNEVQFGAFCDANGITHNFSAPRTPQSKGVVELIIEQRVKLNQKTHILELKQRNYEQNCSDILYAISIMEDTA